jgi:hypothetical protein
MVIRTVHPSLLMTLLLLLSRVVGMPQPRWSLCHAHPYAAGAGWRSRLLPCASTIRPRALRRPWHAADCPVAAVVMVLPQDGIRTHARTSAITANCTQASTRAETCRRAAAKPWWLVCHEAGVPWDCESRARCCTAGGCARCCADRANCV